MINEKLIEFSDQIDEARMSASCRLRQNELPKKLSVFFQMQCFAGLLKQKFTSLLCAFEA